MYVEGFAWTWSVVICEITHSISSALMFGWIVDGVVNGFEVLKNWGGW